MSWAYNQQLREEFILMNIQCCKCGACNYIEITGKALRYKHLVELYNNPDYKHRETLEDLILDTVSIKPIYMCYSCATCASCDADTSLRSCSICNGLFCSDCTIPQSIAVDLKKRIASVINDGRYTCIQCNPSVPSKAQNKVSSRVKLWC